MRSTSVAVVVSSLLVVSSLSVLHARQDVKAAIESANKQFAAAFAKGDAKAIANMYTSAGIAYPPNGEPVRGREAIGKMWQGVIGAGIKEVTLTTTDVETHGDTAIETGTAVLRLAGGKEADRVKYIVIWKREGGQWKLHRDIWNTSMPAAH